MDEETRMCGHCGLCILFFVFCFSFFCFCFCFFIFCFLLLFFVQSIILEVKDKVGKIEEDFDTPAAGDFGRM